MGKAAAPSHRLDDRATEKLINHPLVRERIPSIATTAKKVTKVVKRCASCGRQPRRAAKVTKKIDLNAVREHIAGLPPGQKAKLLKLVNAKELVVPYVRAKDKRRVKLRIN